MFGSETEERLFDRAEAKEQALEELKSYFVSSNGIPVDRAVIKAEDFWRIYNKSKQE